MTATTTPHDDLAFVRSACPVVHRIGGAWFFAPQVARIGAHAGIADQFALYAAGRGGVLGDAHPAVIASAFAFFPPELVLAKYGKAIAVHNPRECARIYARGQAAWAEATFASVPKIGRLAQLGRRIADSVLPMGLPLFAGWRAEPQPAHPAAAAALAMQVLRELRGDLHIHAVTAHQLTPVEAILGKDGPDRALELHYPEPYPPPEQYTDRRRAAEDLTDRMVAPSYAVLDPDERAEFLDIAHTALRVLEH